MYEFMTEAPGDAGRGWSLLWRQPAAETAGAVYFAVVPVFVGTEPLLHYAFVDEGGDVLLTAFTRRPGMESTAGDVTPSRVVDLIDPKAFDRLATRVCVGATLVGFQRVRQGGLLPDGALAASRGLECACRRFQQVVRARAVDMSEDGELTLEACLRGVGLPVEFGANAVAYALGVRRLWRWARPLALG
jgi:hypothetical protein